MSDHDFETAAVVAARSGVSRETIRLRVEAGELVPSAWSWDGKRRAPLFKPGTAIPRKKDSGPGRGSA